MERSKNKVFVAAETTIVMYNHGAYWCFINSTHTGKCRKFQMDQNLSHVNHYRNKCVQKETSETVMETSAWKFKEELIKAVNETLNATGFKP